MLYNHFVHWNCTPKYSMPRVPTKNRNAAGFPRSSTVGELAHLLLLIRPKWLLIPIYTRYVKPGEISLLLHGKSRKLQCLNHLESLVFLPCLSDRHFRIFPKKLLSLRFNQFQSKICFLAFPENTPLNFTPVFLIMFPKHP